MSLHVLICMWCSGVFTHFFRWTKTSIQGNPSKPSRHGPPTINICTCSPVPSQKTSVEKTQHDRTWHIWHMNMYTVHTWGYPQIIHFNGIFPDKSSVLGVPHLWKILIFTYVYNGVQALSPRHRAIAANRPETTGMFFALEWRQQPWGKATLAAPKITGWVVHLVGCLHIPSVMT